MANGVKRSGCAVHVGHVGRKVTVTVRTTLRKLNDALCVLVKQESAPYHDMQRLRIQNCTCGNSTMDTCFKASYGPEFIGNIESTSLRQMSSTKES